MNVIGKKLPRIYSISTIGIRNHNNVDFLIHPLRTDFTGQSGTGKSLIGADLPQLILTAGRFYKSATKPKGGVSRDYNTATLSTVDFAYAFMNVEVKHGQFIVLGVQIRRSPKQLYPFIIQSNIGIHPEKNPKFTPFSEVLRYKDFIVNGEIPTLENLKDHLEKRSLYLKSFYHDISRYHKLLYLNKVLHVDLSLNENLQKQYAHTLQSLARGEDIDTSGIKFKRFLFQDDDTIIEKFKSQATEIEEDHNRYLRDWEARNNLVTKKNLLLSLLASKKTKTEAYEERLRKETFFYFQQKKQKEADLAKAINLYFHNELETFIIEERKLAIEIDQLSINSQEKSEELKRKSNLLETANEQLKDLEQDHAYLGEIIPLIEKEKNELKEKYDKIETFKNWLKVYNSIDAIKDRFVRQSKIKIQKDKLKALKAYLQQNNLVELYVQSEYSKSIKAAVEFYAKKKESLLLQIDYLTNLKKIIKEQSSESFAGWAIKEGIKLSELQESVLFHFAQLSTKFDEEKSFIPDPKRFIKSIKGISASDKSYIIDLSGLYYHIPKREHYVFNDPQLIKSEIEKIRKSFEDTIAELTSELAVIENLDKLFLNFNYSEDHLSAFLNHDLIDSFVEDPTLNLTDAQFEEITRLYIQDSKNRSEEQAEPLYREKLSSYESKLGERATVNARRTIFTQQSIQAKKEIGEINEIITRNHARINLLSNTELVGIELKITKWRSDIRNVLSESWDELSQQYRQKHKASKSIDDLSKFHIDLVRKSGAYEEEIKALEFILPTLNENFSQKEIEHQDYFKIAFNSSKLSENITKDYLEQLRLEEQSSRTKFEDEYYDVLDTFIDELKDNPKLTNHQFDLNTLILELIPHDIITNKENPEETLHSDIEHRLAVLHQKIQELNKEEAKKIFNTVRDLKSIVQRQVTFLESVKALLKDFKLASWHKVVLNWDYSHDYNFKWIDNLSKDIESLSFTDDLFGEKSKVSAQELLERTFKKYCSTKLDAKAYDILNPFNYYEASAVIADPNGNPSPGSAGQNYGMLALLCIAKLSIVEGRNSTLSSKPEPGIRILPIDEVAGLGENFNMLYDIAQRLDYQIFTMTVSANDLTFENGKQIYYEFIKNSDENLFEYNEGIQASFSKENLVTDIETHFKDSVYSLNQLV